MKIFTASMAALMLGATMSTAAVTFYTDQTYFESLYPDLTTEDYSNTLVPPNSVESVSGPFNSLTDNACFYPGAIVEGVSFDNLDGGNNVVLTPPFAGVTDVAVGPNTFDHNSEYSFSVPVNAFGVYIVMAMGDGSVDIEVFGAGGSLGTSSSPGNLAGEFWGVFSDEEITRIEFIEPVTRGELFSNVQFGVALSLDHSTWGAIKASF